LVVPMLQLADDFAHLAQALSYLMDCIKQAATIGVGVARLQWQWRVESFRVRE
jgi:hypothetical protein